MGVQGQREIAVGVEGLAEKIREILKISGEESYTRFFGCELVSEAARRCGETELEEWEDSERNLCLRCGVRVEGSMDLGNIVGGVAVAGGAGERVRILLNERFSPSRMMFWLVHEICHYLLNQPGGFSTRAWTFYRLRNSPEISRHETLAYLLTAALIVPRARLAEALKSAEKGDKEAYHKLARRFVVHPYHMGTLLMRASRQDLVDLDGYDEARRQYYELSASGSDS
jgi:Zn-dependent peptidase ImmA (M78 family)